MNTKGGGTRFVNLSPEAQSILDLCDKNRDNVFDGTNLRREFAAATAAVGIKDFHFHDLRHTHATWMGQRGAGLHVVMKSLGHSQIETTMKYLHVLREDVKEAQAKLPPLIEGTAVQLKRDETA